LLQNLGEIKALSEQLKTALPLLEQRVQAADIKQCRTGILCGIASSIVLPASVVALSLCWASKIGCQRGSLRASWTLLIVTMTGLYKKNSKLSKKLCRYFILGGLESSGALIIGWGGYAATITSQWCPSVADRCWSNCLERLPQD